MPVGSVHPPAVLRLDCYWHVSRRDLPPGQSAARSGCKHHGVSAVLGPTSQTRTYFSRALVSTESASRVCCLCRWLGDTLRWYKAVYWLHWLRGPTGGAGQGQLPPVFCLGPPGMSDRVICRWLLLMLGLEVLRKGCDPRLAVASAGSGACLSEVWGTPRPDAAV